jgi:hypothetical protein
MTALSTEDNLRHSTAEHDPDALNSVLEVTGKSWRHLFAQSEWKPQHLPFCGLRGKR